MKRHKVSVISKDGDKLNFEIIVGLITFAVCLWPCLHSVSLNIQKTQWKLTELLDTYSDVQLKPFNISLEKLNFNNPSSRYQIKHYLGNEVTGMWHM